MRQSLEADEEVEKKEGRGGGKSGKAWYTYSSFTVVPTNHTISSYLVRDRHSGVFMPTSNKSLLPET